MNDRFVILHHTGVDEEHFDLMLESNKALMTWACCENPMGLGEGQSASAQELLDHRKEYLQYEGVISGGRGEVKRVVEGQYSVLGRNNGKLHVRLMALHTGHAVDLHLGQSEVKRA
ncbi:MAG: hypothetical protein HN909_05190 [Phycisphaerales bacterium]|jgi:hypothetical protein|nr:hypothetical protein [Phycisphaerales bacterium]MBT7171147.1 hypothetical protein [Phycisphaerales bacterium]